MVFYQTRRWRYTQTKNKTKQNIPNLLKGSSEELKERKKLEKRWEIRQHSEKVPLFLAHVEVGVAGKR